jgi:NifU-like protein involved in Fe-S cluster formation
MVMRKLVILFVVISLIFFIKVQKGKIKDVKFLSFGCASNIATRFSANKKVKG